jgi:hypothetical protein
MDATAERAERHRAAGGRQRRQLDPGVGPRIVALVGVRGSAGASADDVDHAAGHDCIEMLARSRHRSCLGPAGRRLEDEGLAPSDAEAIDSSEEVEPTSDLDRPRAAARRR